MQLLRGQGVCSTRNSDLGGVVLLGPVCTHLKFSSFLFSVYVVHHHQLSVHRSLRAVGAFSLLCYCGLEGDMCLERTVMSEPGLCSHPSAGEGVTDSCTFSCPQVERYDPITHGCSASVVLLLMKRTVARHVRGASASLRGCWPGFRPF